MQHQSIQLVFNDFLDLSFGLTIQGTLPQLIAPTQIGDYTLERNIYLSTIKNVFYFQTDNPITYDSSYTKYFVDISGWLDTTMAQDLNPMYYQVLTQKNGSFGTIGTDNLGKHFLRYISSQLFGTYLGVDLFNNEDAVYEDISSNAFTHVYTAVLNKLKQVDKTFGATSTLNLFHDSNGYHMRDVSGTYNICYNLVKQMAASEIARLRFNSLELKTGPDAGIGIYNVPFRVGDSIVYTVKVSPDPLQHLTTGLSTPLESKTYVLKLNIISDPVTEISISTTPTPNVTYTVTVSGGAYWISTNGGPAVQQPYLSFTSGNVYKFDQSNISNAGNPLQLNTINGSSAYTTGVVTYGTPGSPNAYTLITVSETTPQLFYYSESSASLGYSVNVPFIWYKFDETIGPSVYNYGKGGSGFNGVLTNPDSILSYSTDIKKYGNSALFSNTTANSKQDYVKIPRILVENNTTWSMSVWIYIVSKSYDTIAVGNWHDGGQTGLYTELFNIFLQSDYYRLHTDAVPWTAGTWTHFVQVSTRNIPNITKKTYINNTLVQNILGAYNEGQYGTYTGAEMYLMSTGSGYNMLNGAIDDFRMYNSELSASDIDDLYNNRTTSIGIDYSTGAALYVVGGCSSSATSPETPTIAYSMDGNTWIGAGRPISGACYTVAWSPNLRMFVAGGVSKYTTTPLNDMAWSKDGITWTAMASPVFGYNDDAGYANNYGLNKIEISIKGCYKVIWSNQISKFIAVGITGGLNSSNIKYSSDGKTWTTASMSDSAYGYSNVIYNQQNTNFIAVGYRRWAVSSNGMNWTVYTNGYTMYDITNNILGGAVILATNGQILTPTDNTASSLLLRPISPRYNIYARTIHSRFNIDYTVENFIVGHSDAVGSILSATASNFPEYGSGGIYSLPSTVLEVRDMVEEVSPNGSRFLIMCDAGMFWAAPNSTVTTLLTTVIPNTAPTTNSYSPAGYGFYCVSSSINTIRE